MPRHDASDTATQHGTTPQSAHRSSTATCRPVTACGAQSAPARTVSAWRRAGTVAPVPDDTEAVPDAGAHSRDLAGPALTKVFPYFHMLSDTRRASRPWRGRSRTGAPGSVISHDGRAVVGRRAVAAEDEVALLGLTSSADGVSPLPPAPAGASADGRRAPVIHARPSGACSSSVRGAAIHRGAGAQHEAGQTRALLASRGAARARDAPAAMGSRRCGRRRGCGND